MTINEIFKAIHGMGNSQELRIMDLSEEEVKNYSKNLGIENIKKRTQELADYLGRDANDFYMDTNSFNPFIYKRGLLNIPIHILDIDYLKQFHVKERIEAQEAELNRCQSNEDFHRLIFLMDKKYRLDAFVSMYDKIPKTMKYKLFMDIYTSSEYGFNVVPKDIVREVFALKPKRSLNKLAKTIGHVKDGYVQIYRGNNTESTAPDQAYSWTTNISTALWFAHRFGNSGEVYQAKVKIENVVDYLTGRNEFEIIVLPDSLEDLKKMDFITLDDFEEFAQENAIIDSYHFFLNEIEEDYFKDPDGIHGMRHMKRVLLLVLTLGHYLEMDSEDLEILANAALYHDIGRNDDGIDRFHGLRSIAKLKSLGLELNLSDEQYEYFKYVVGMHDYDDEEAFIKVKEYKMADQEKAIHLLKVFKDCDNLDRVRLKDLDTNYLRTDTAKRMVQLAQEFLRGIK